MVIAIAGFLSAITYNVFFDTNRVESVSKQTAVVTATIERARAMTLSSENDSVYGVHVASSTIVLFKGSVYDPATTTNQVQNIMSPAEITGYSFNGGSSNILFKRLTGETDNYGTIVVSVPGTEASSTITIYATGLVETN